jgi:hypothetical protein
MSHPDEHFELLILHRNSRIVIRWISLINLHETYGKGNAHSRYFTASQSLLLFHVEALGYRSTSSL